MCKENKSQIIFVLGTNVSGANDVVKLIKELVEERNLNIEAIKCRNAGVLDEIFKKNPIGVVLMNEMRQYGPVGEVMSLGSFSTSISTHVNKKCKKKEIPLLKIKDGFRNGGSADQRKKITHWLQQQFLS